MLALDKKSLSERDICTKFITPALVNSGWNVMTQIREEVTFTSGRVMVRGKIARRGESKRADYILFLKPGIPLAIVEAKDNKHSPEDGLQQALEYAQTLDIPFVFASNGDSFSAHDRTVTEGDVETSLALDEFPTPADLWARYCASKGLDSEQAAIVAQDYFEDVTGKTPRYYQQTAINRSVEAIAKGQNRLLLVMATGTGKTLVAFQIIWRLWKSKTKKRVLFLADRNILVDQTKTNDFQTVWRRDDQNHQPPGRSGIRDLPVALSGCNRNRRSAEHLQTVLARFLRFDYCGRMSSGQRGGGFGVARDIWITFRAPAKSV